MTRGESTREVARALEGVARDDVLDGIVVEILPRALYRVEIGPGERLLAHVSKDPRRNFVRILKGDRVSVRRTSRDRTRGCIIGRR